MWILVWIFLCFVVAFAGTGKKVGYWGTFFLSLLLSPLIGLIIAIVSGSDTPAVQVTTKKNTLQTKEEQNRHSASEFDNLLQSADLHYQKGNPKLALSLLIDAKNVMEKALKSDPINESAQLKLEHVDEQINDLRTKLKS